MTTLDKPTGNGGHRPPFFYLAPLLAANVLLLVLAHPARGDVVDSIRRSGHLGCGVVMEPDDWNNVERHGDTDDFGREFCKAVAVVLMHDSPRVAFREYPAEDDALSGLQHGEIDLVVGVTPSISAQADHNVLFGPVVLYDAQGFMVSRKSGVTRVADLAGKTVCTGGSGEAETVLSITMRDRHVAYIPSPFSEQGEMDAALVGGRCVAESADLTKLAFSRMQFHARAADFTFLPETLTIDPVAVAYRAGDVRFAAIVNGTVNALIQAEADDISSANISEHKDDDDPAIKRLLGTDFIAGRSLGLDNGWAARAITAIGNYGEIYDRTLGAGSAMKLPRGLNALWTEGGLMRPEPIR